MLFAIVDKSTLEIEKLTRDDSEVYDTSCYDKIQVDNYDTRNTLKFVRDESGQIVKREFNIYGIVDRTKLELQELIHENEYKGHDDTVFALVTFTRSEISRLGPSTLTFNDDFTYFLDPKKLSKHDDFVNIRRERNSLLTETDWMMHADTPLTEEQIVMIKDYRQKLRDITSNVHPSDVVFPVKPFPF